MQKQPLVLDRINLHDLEIVNDYIHKIFFTYLNCNKITESETKTKLFDLINLFFDFYNELSKIPISSVYLIKNGIFLEMLYFIFKFKSNPIKNSNTLNAGNKNKISIKSIKIILNLVTIKNLKQSHKDLIEILHSIFDKQLSINFFKIQIEIDSINFLQKLKSDIENPEFIWNRVLRMEIKTKILDSLKKINESKAIDHIIELKNFRYISYQNELKINNIYIRLYNKEPTWHLNDPDLFLEKLKEFLINQENINKENTSEIINSIANVINFSKANENILLNDENFWLKFFKLLNLKGEESLLIVPSCLNLLVIFSLKATTLSFVITLNPNTFFILINIIESNNAKECIDPILKILKNVFKFPELLDKINLSIFNFLLKKVIFLKETINKTNKENVNNLRIEILKVIRKYVQNEKVGFAIKSLYEFYLPNKIIENLFNLKETGEISLNWLDQELELPDLIWNTDAMNQSKKLLEEDCKFILSDENNIENFPQNFLTHKLDPHKCFFFEISDEFRLENIYLRIFNKDPSYNIGKCLIIFFKNIVKCTMETIKSITIYHYNIENVDNTNLNNNKQLELLKQKYVTCLTAVLLIIEQINFNDFNECLGISSVDEMKNVIKEEYEKALINLVQRSFDYQRLLSVSIIHKLINTGKVIFSLDSGLYSTFSHFDNNIRLVYLQIVYLLCLNKSAMPLVMENFDVMEIMERMMANSEKIGDCN